MTSAFSGFATNYSDATITLNKTSFNTSVVLDTLFDGTTSNIAMTLYSEADKLLIDNLGYQNVTTIVG